MTFFNFWSWLCEYSAKKFSLEYWPNGESRILSRTRGFAGRLVGCEACTAILYPGCLDRAYRALFPTLEVEEPQAIGAGNIEQVRKIVAVSPALAEQIRSFNPDVDVSIIGNVIRTDFFLPSNSGSQKLEQTKRFFCVAMLSEGKGIRYLLQAVKLLAERGVNCLEVFIGGTALHVLNSCNWLSRWVCQTNVGFWGCWRGIR